MPLTRLPAEGILALHDQKLRDLYDLKVSCIWSVHPHAYLPSCCRFLYNAIQTSCWRDGSSATLRNAVGASRVSSTSSYSPTVNKYSLLKSILRYLRYVKPSYDNFVGPSAKYADIVSHIRSYSPSPARPHKSSCLPLQIVPGSNNAVAIELISTHVRRELTHRAQEFRGKITSEIKRNPSLNPSQITVGQLSNLYIIPQTPQLKVLLRCASSGQVLMRRRVSIPN